MQISFDEKVEGFWNQPQKLKTKNTILFCVAINELKLDRNVPLNRTENKKFLTAYQVR